MQQLKCLTGGPYWYTGIKGKAANYSAHIPQRRAWVQLPYVATMFDTRRTDTLTVMAPLPVPQMGGRVGNPKRGLDSGAPHESGQLVPEVSVV